MDEEADLFKALSDPTRLRLAVLLALRGESCVCHLAAALEAPDFRISRHLGVLRAAGLVEARREGTWMYYQLVPPRSDLQECLLGGLRRHLRDHPTTRADLRRLSRLECAPR